VLIRLTSDQIVKLLENLRRAGRNEIGGQLFGEQLAPSDFRVTELTVQARPGTFSRFVVDLVQAARDAIRFFGRTEHRYERFNYIGEWHSHPSFDAQPSLTDIETMRELVTDPDFRGNFAVLMIVRLNGRDATANAWVFDPRGTDRVIDVELERGRV